MGENAAFKKVVQAGQILPDQPGTDDTILAPLDRCRLMCPDYRGDLFLLLPPSPALFHERAGIRRRTTFSCSHHSAPVICLFEVGSFIEPSAKHLQEG